MVKKEIREILRSPEELKVLRKGNGNVFQTDDGNQYPIMDEGIVCLIKENERQVALNDDNFYQNNPFGEVDWSDVSDVDSGVERELKNLIKQYSNKALIIDVGSGAGRISNYLSLVEYENVVSLDYSLNSLRQVRNNSNNVCIWGNNLHLPFASASFDLVISSGVIHHTPDPHKSLQECIRILKSSGRLYLRTYNFHSLYCYLYYTYGSFLRLFESGKRTRFLSDLFGFKLYKFARSTLYSLPEREERILRAKFANLFIKNMVYFFTTSEIKNLFKENGLTIETSKKRRLTHRMHFYVAKKN